MVTIRRLQVGEVELYKQMRLASLRDAPYAFSSTYESALQRSDESWCAQTEGTTQGSDRATFIAFSDDTPVGMAALYRLEDQADTGEILQVWVSPTHRGVGIAWALMDAVFDWARENAFRTIKATVTGRNARALKFYARYGFSICAETLPVGSEEVYMVKEVR